MSGLRSLAVLVLALGLSSCDLFGGLDVVSPTQVYTIPPFERTTLDLASELGIERESSLSFRVESEGGSVTADVQFPDALVVTPIAVGLGTVTVQALLGGSAEGAATFQFDVEDPGPLPSPERAVVARDGRIDLDVAPLFRPVSGTEYVVLGTSGPVSASISGGSLLSIFPTGLGDGSVTVSTTRFVPQRLIVPVRVVESDGL
ncbi:hypothetical protein [Rubrivirga marina]|uniref:Lipoprotein n=1 Tax=Rubrivirga marina TaxID=1196024 RepID=A0A271J0L3_9BACT|nr:hypothetical protein [Rubrivirga marina]PAP77051.1 hypothetical protein BSZ37_11720 [Rubrivirga marina]